MNREFNKTEEDILDVINEAPATRTNETVQGGEGDEDDVDDTVEGGGGDEKTGTDGDEDEEASGKKTEEKQAGKAGDKQPDQRKGGQRKKEDIDNHIAQTRRLGADNARLKSDNAKLSTKVKEVETALNAYKEAYATTNSFGLTPQELSEGARLIALYKKSPTDMITEVLTVSKQNGIDLSKILPGSVDTVAIRNLIQQELGTKLQPIVDRETKTKEEAEFQTAAKEELDEFLASNQDAELHLDALAKIIDNTPGLGIASAWDKLQLWMLRNGIDPSLPPGRANDQRSSNQQSQQNRRPIPNGNGRQVMNSNGSGGNASMQKKTQVPVNASLDDIITSSMQEAGIDYRR